MRLDEIPRNYDRASRYYDRLTDLVFGGLLRIEKYRERTVSLLDPGDGDVVLDVGCGTGRNLPLLIPRIGERGRIVALDYSAGMLEKARERARAQGWTNVETLRGDAVRLDGVEAPVDALISVWCYGIVYDLEAALTRAVDVLRPGGRLAVMDFGRTRPERGPLRWLYPVYAALLRRAGIDTAEDLDDARLREKWERGRRLLRSRLTDVVEETYLLGTGLILAGRRPTSAGDAGSA